MRQRLSKVILVLLVALSVAVFVPPMVGGCDPASHGSNPC